LRPGMVLLKNFISHDEQVLHFHLLEYAEDYFVIPYKMLHLTALVGQDDAYSEIGLLCVR